MPMPNIPETATIAQIDNAIRLANAEGLLKYKIAELADARLEIAKLKLELELETAKRVIAAADARLARPR